MKNFPYICITHYDGRCMRRTGGIFLMFFLLCLPAVMGQVVTARLVPAILPGQCVVGICVTDIGTGESVAAYNEKIEFVPASVLKLLTTATVLGLYDADYCMETRVSHTGKIGADGVLRGDLYLTGGGDPSLGSEFSLQPRDRFEKECIAALKKAGVHRIEGRVIADASLFDMEGVSPKWLWEDLGNYFAAGAYGINFSDNMYRLALRSGKSGTRPEILSTSPVMEKIRFTNFLEAKDNRKDSAYIYGAPFSEMRRIYGSIPANRKEFVIKGDMPDPVEFVAEHITAVLREAGIEVAGEAGTVFIRNAGEKRSLLFSFRSDPLSRLVRVTNERSNNLYAECLLRLIALKKYPVGSARGGIGVMRDFWNGKGVPADGMLVYDGCGLSPVNRISPRALCAVLAAASKMPGTGTVFRQSLPIAGREGTVGSFLKGTPLEGKMRLKSGSMAQVQCYAGYYSGKREYAVVIMVNSFTMPRAELCSRLEKLLTDVLREIEK